MRKLGSFGPIVLGWLAAMLLAGAIPAVAATSATNASPDVVSDRLGTVAFSVSCAPSVQSGFDRGVALLHNFWYEEARPQFEKILKNDPGCAMAQWGIAMSLFHQIWDRPDDQAQATAWKALAAATAHPAKTARERSYIAALAAFFRPGSATYETRIAAYSAAMGKLYAAYPDDVDAGAFYALSLLAAEDPSDTSLRQEHAAMAVLTPLWATHPDHPGLVHYVIHACDNPALAPQGLTAARAYGRIAPSGPHAVHMPGHIFSRLGLWQEDIAANVGSVQASRAAEMHHESGWMDQFHSDDFLVYAYLQSGQEAKARNTMEESAAAIAHYESMGEMTADHYMTGMFPYYRLKLPIFIALETRDWNGVLDIKGIDDAPADTQTQRYWARAIADGHLHRAAYADKDLAAFDALLEDMRKGRLAYAANGTGAKIRRGEILAWAQFAQGKTDAALASMRASADLQDQVGQGEVDIPAREMFADMLLELKRPSDALAEYQRSLTLSPNRFNSLYGAALASEATGDAVGARGYYTALLKATDDGAHSSRPEIAHARVFVADAKTGTDLY